MVKKRTRMRPLRDDDCYSRLWRLVDGAVSDALKQHPDYLAPEKTNRARRSICKRVVGALHGHLVKAKRGQR